MPIDRTVVEGLLEQLRASRGPDTNLNDDLWRALLPESRERSYLRRTYALGPLAAPDFTDSVDAALTLVERAPINGRAAHDILADALDRMSREGWRSDLPIGPQIARFALIELLTALTQGADHADAAQPPHSKEKTDAAHS